ELLEMVIERVGEGVLVRRRDTPVELASPCARQSRQGRFLQEAVREGVLPIRRRPGLANDIRAHELHEVTLDVRDSGDVAQHGRFEGATEDRANLSDSPRIARESGDA